MKLLLDTQVLIWWLLDDAKLSSSVRALLVRPENAACVSHASLFEIAIKQKIGKLPELDVAIDVLVGLIEGDGFLLLPVQTGHIQAYADIPLFPNHRDPFDRLLLAVALDERMPIVSADENFMLYTDLIHIIGNCS